MKNKTIVVFVSGNFNILHHGHLRLLRFAKECGTKLIVGINSDKIANYLGFRPNYGVEQAVQDLCDAFKENRFTNSMSNTLYFNVKRMKELEVN